MKHKRFQEVFPYTYVLVHKESGKKYYGARGANVARNLPPLRDFGIKYFSSGSFKPEFKEFPERFHIQLQWTFDTIEEAIEWEFRVVSKIMHFSNWVNVTNSYGRVITEKHRQQTIKRMKANNPSKNGLTEEHKKKIGISASRVLAGKPKSESHKRAMSLSRKGSTPWNLGKKTGPLTPEHIEKIIHARKGKKRGKYKSSGRIRKSVDKELITRGSCIRCRKIYDIGNLTKHVKDSKCQKKIKA